MIDYLNHLENGIVKMTKQKIKSVKKVIKGLKKASKTHAAQAKVLKKAIRSKKGQYENSNFRCVRS